MSQKRSLVNYSQFIAQNLSFIQVVSGENDCPSVFMPLTLIILINSLLN